MPKFYHLQLVRGSRLPKPPHSLILKPQIPTNLFVDYNDDVIEDWFTPRVCLGESIQDCIAGIAVPASYYELYRTVDNLDLEQPNSTGPSTPDMDYGTDFVLADWYEYMSEKKPNTEITEEFLIEEFYGCVPDASETNEYWSLKPVRVEYLGVLNAKTGHVAVPEETSAKKVARQLRAFLARY